LNRLRALLSNTALALGQAGLLALIVVALIASTALAAKGASQGGSGSSLSLAMYTDANGNGQPNYMDDITFDLSTSSTAQLTVGVRCWQGSDFVFDSYVGYFEGAWFNPYFTLGSTYWAPSLDATCTARLFYYNRRGAERVLATTDFGVAP